MTHETINETFICHQREHVDRDRFPAIFGCDVPEDDVAEAPSCPTCKAYLHHDEACEHGRWYVGVKGYGFRTNRCIRCWSLHPFVTEVMRAFGWASSEGGGFTAAYGQDPPAKLMEAISFVRNARASVKDQEWREKRAEAKARDALA